MAEINRNIEGLEILKVITDEDILLNGYISNANAKLISENGSVTVTNFINGYGELFAVAENDIWFQGKFEDASSTKLISNNGNVTTGQETSHGVVTKNAKLSVVANNDVNIYAGQINDKCNASIVSKHGMTRIVGEIMGQAKLYVISEGDIEIFGNIGIQQHAYTHFPQVELISTQGSIRIYGGINDASSVRLTAAIDILIRDGINPGADDFWHPDTRVVAKCEGKITVNQHIKVKTHSYIEFRAHRGIEINGLILMADYSHIKFSVASEGIQVNGDIIGHPNLIYHNPTGLIGGTGGGRHLAIQDDWIDEYKPSIVPAITATWWNNWFWSYGFVSDQIYKPKTYHELVKLMKELSYIKNIRVKGAGGGWSFSDVTLPHNDIEEINNVSIFERGKNNTNDLRYVLRHMVERNTPMDMYPFQVAKSLEHSSDYDDNLLKKNVKSGIDLKSTPSSFKMIDTKNLCSSLQCKLKKKIAYNKQQQEKTHRYWVEAGITMVDLNKLLDHNLPRLAIEASGGSPGATLAGTISTATHGGEFKKPLLIDRILAVHLIGPDGQEWWIEGSNRVITQLDLNTIYNGHSINFVSTSSWNEIKTGISADDFLKAVVTSMGSMGIIYSVVLEVVPQFSIQQATYKYQSINGSSGWEKLLTKAGITSDQLLSRDTSANTALLDFLINGSINGTGISNIDNQYMDLAINPISKSCWIVNRKFLPIIADDDKEMDLISNYTNSLNSSLGEGRAPFNGSKLMSRLLEFLDMPTEDIGLLLELGHMGNFIGGVQKYSSMFLSSIIAHLQIKAMWSAANHPTHTFKGHKFLGDVLDGILDALQETHEQPRSVMSGLSSRVGAIGWPNTGLPGRGFEVAISPSIAFSYVNDIISIIDEMKLENKVFLGYISVRLCPSTRTLMGMQQFKQYAVMVEIVAHRTPESNIIFDNLIDFTKIYSGFDYGQFPPFHWGLETEKIDQEYLLKTPFNQPYRGALTRLDVFKLAKRIIRNDHHEAIFDNTFVARMGF